MAEISHNGLKTLWEKEKLLITSNFSFSHSVLKRLVRPTRKNQGLFGKGLLYDKSLNVTILKAVADDNLTRSIARMTVSLIDRVENTV